MRHRLQDTGRSFSDISKDIGEAWRAIESGAKAQMLDDAESGESAATLWATMYRNRLICLMPSAPLFITGKARYQVSVQKYKGSPEHAAYQRYLRDFKKSRDA